MLWRGFYLYKQITKKEGQKSAFGLGMREIVVKD
jgi:hypothetical protein